MSFLGKTHSEETKKIIGEKSKKHNANPEVRERARRVAIEFNKTHNIADLQKKSEKWQKALAEGRVGGHAQTEEGKKFFALSGFANIRDVGEPELKTLDAFNDVTRKGLAG
jgi:hypothetical protein